ncbi:MAG: hypothetical protein R2857_02070 [Vampirovibrionales bacterium]
MSTPLTGQSVIPNFTSQAGIGSIASGTTASASSAPRNLTKDQQDLIRGIQEATSDNNLRLSFSLNNPAYSGLSMNQYTYALNVAGLGSSGGGIGGLGATIGGVPLDLLSNGSLGGGPLYGLNAFTSGQDAGLLARADTLLMAAGNNPMVQSLNQRASEAYAKDLQGKITQLVQQRNTLIQKALVNKQRGLDIQQDLYNIYYAIPALIQQAYQKYQLGPFADLQGGGSSGSLGGLSGIGGLGSSLGGSLGFGSTSSTSLLSGLSDSFSRLLSTPGATNASLTQQQSSNTGSNQMMQMMQMMMPMMMSLAGGGGENSDKLATLMPMMMQMFGSMSGGTGSTDGSSNMMTQMMGMMGSLLGSAGGGGGNTTATADTTTGTGTGGLDITSLLSALSGSKKVAATTTKVVEQTLPVFWCRLDQQWQCSQEG